jgi:phosphonate transport system substrate-binding protein
MKKTLFIGIFLVIVLAACAPASTEQEAEPFVIGAIPDQDPELLQRRFGLLADHLSEELGVPVEYIPVTDYTASVTAFRVGDLDMVWFGGLTGVQARLQVDDSQAIIQRDIDDQFHSVFIANKSSGLAPIDDVAGLSQLEGSSFTFGSASSTSGRLMPQYYLGQAGVELDEFNGEPGFSGSHTTTIDQVTRAFTKLDINNPDHKNILDLFSAQAFIVTENDNYLQIETVGQEVGLIN